MFKKFKLRVSGLVNSNLAGLQETAVSSSRPMFPLSSYDYWRDPLYHPDIALMTERERGDLPFNPHNIRS